MVLATKLTVRVRDRCFRLVSFATTKSTSLTLRGFLLAGLKNWSSARLSSRRSACKRKGSERVLADTRGHRVRFL